MFAKPFTETNLQNKLRDLFFENIIPATLVTAKTYPCVTVTVNKALSVTNADGIYGYAYTLDIDMYDLLNGKKVIVYHCGIGENTLNISNDGAANILWEATNALVSEFATDWKTTH